MRFLLLGVVGTVLTLGYRAPTGVMATASSPPETIEPSTVAHQFPNHSTSPQVGFTYDASTSGEKIPPGFNARTRQGNPGRSRPLDQSDGLNAALPHWTGRFDYAGVAYDYTMVGTDPAQGSATTVVPTEIISFRFVFSNGIVLDPSTDQYGGVTILESVLNSPIFKLANFSAGNTSLGLTQFGDAFQRGNFWNFVSTTSPDYHVLLGQPQIFNQTFIVPADKGSAGPPKAGSNLILGTVDIDWLDQQIRQLLMTLNIDPRSLPIFLSHNTVLSSRGSLAAFAYHDFVPPSAQSGGQAYIEAPDIDDNIFSGTAKDVSDIESLSHELAEWIDDPFVDNVVPSWRELAAASSTQCFEDFLLEVGDPIQDHVFPRILVTLNGLTYHLQDEVFLSWFSRRSPSTGVNGYYTLANALNTFSESCPNRPTNVQFDSSTYTVDEDAGFAIINVSRTGNTTGKFTVDFATSDVGAQQRSDYALAAGTLTFAPGDRSKTFTVLIVDDVYVDGNRVLNLTLSNSTGGAVLVSPSVATLTIVDNDSISATTNPLDTARFFVQQHYYDFLSRYPDPGGWDFWTGQITQCGTDATCLRNKRIDVSNAYFYELEYQQTGAYVFRLYRAAFGNSQPFPNPDGSNPTEANKLPGYLKFAFDRARVVGGASLAQGQSDFAAAFVRRTEFTNKYSVALDAPGFVDAVLATIRNDLGVELMSQRAALINLFNQAGGDNAGRGAVLYRLADDNAQTNPISNRAFIDEEYNTAFVATQYFGYLRRDADIGGFLFWLGQVSSAPLRDLTKQHAMVCSFITSAEYQQRFSPVVTHANAECPR